MHVFIQKQILKRRALRNSNDNSKITVEHYLPCLPQIEGSVMNGVNSHDPCPGE